MMPSMWTEFSSNNKTLFCMYMHINVFVMLSSKVFFFQFIAIQLVYYIWKPLHRYNWIAFDQNVQHNDAQRNIWNRLRWKIVLYVRWCTIHGDVLAIPTDIVCVKVFCDTWHWRDNIHTHTHIISMPITVQPSPSLIPSIFHCLLLFWMTCCIIRYAY